MGDCSLSAIAINAFIGRQRELEELVSGLSRATPGHATLFLGSGEPGIGKLGSLNNSRRAPRLMDSPYSGDDAGRAMAHGLTGRGSKSCVCASPNVPVTYRPAQHKTKLLSRSSGSYPNDRPQLRPGEASQSLAIAKKLNFSSSIPSPQFSRTSHERSPYCL
jgi:hypothetical protein